MAKQKTLMLDDDVAQRLDEAARVSGQPQEIVGNEVLRRALESSLEKPLLREPYRVQPFDLGQMRPGFSLDCTGELLGQLDEIERS